MIIVLLIVVFLIFGRGRFRPPWQDRGHYEDRPSSEGALDILKKRYAKGEITKEEFEQMKKDILS
jgi:putative membrane protein